jgi:hypothetical protein
VRNNLYSANPVGDNAIARTTFFRRKSRAFADKKPLSQTIACNRLNAMIGGFIS